MTTEKPREELDALIASVYRQTDTHVFCLEGDENYAATIVCNRKGLCYQSAVQTQTGYRSMSRDFTWDHLCEVANTLGIKLNIDN